MAIRILLVEDHQIVRQGLRSLLAKEPDFEVVAEADNGADALTHAVGLGVDLVLMDLSLPGMSGIEATRRIVAELPQARVIALTMHSEKRYLSETLKAGAKGYLVKESATLELVEAIREVAGGGVYLSRSLRGVELPGEATDHPGKTVPAAALSPRERQVLQKIAEGKSTKEIAFAFGVSIKTIETQRSQAMKKLCLRNIAELTKYALREGLVPL
jgi:DNA-binding NarL/FixJ family response regulator